VNLVKDLNKKKEYFPGGGFSIFIVFYLYSFYYRKIPLTYNDSFKIMFYLIQYSISNLNAFMLILTIGYSLYCYVDNTNSTKNIGKQEDTKEKSHKQEINENNGNLSK
jgi:hypothetical protein